MRMPCCRVRVFSQQLLASRSLATVVKWCWQYLAVVRPGQERFHAVVIRGAKVSSHEMPQVLAKSQKCCKTYNCDNLQRR